MNDEADFLAEGLRWLRIAHVRRAWLAGPDGDTYLMLDDGGKRARLLASAFPASMAAVEPGVEVRPRWYVHASRRGGEAETMDQAREAAEKALDAIGGAQ